MKKIKNRYMVFWLSIALVLGQVPSFSNSASSYQLALTDTASYLYNIVKSPQVGSIGGEWAVFGLARSNYPVDEAYFQDYYDTVLAYVKACKGKLHVKKYTEYSRLIVALTSIGKDPSNVGGYNLLTPLGDYEKTIWQGLNGPIWALIALDSGQYQMPVHPTAKVKATRQMYVDRILACQLPDGGWSLFGGTAAASDGDGISDPDITGMALQALAKYQDQPKVKKATEEALMAMSLKQNAKGGFESWGSVNSESCVQIIVALCELGIPLDDKRFVKNGYSLMDNLMTFYKKGNGFLHTHEGSGSSQMATEQAFYGLVAVSRMESDLPSLYRMTDPRVVRTRKQNSPVRGDGLLSKNKAIRFPEIQSVGLTVEDISAHRYQPSIEAFISRGIVEGEAFYPEAPLTYRAFSEMVIKAMGLEVDVRGNALVPHLVKDESYGIFHTLAVNDLLELKKNKWFKPDTPMSREAFVMCLDKLATFCGLKNDWTVKGARDILAQFSDYVKCEVNTFPMWALAYQNEWLDASEMYMRPTSNISRSEAVKALHWLFIQANLM